MRGSGSELPAPAFALVASGRFSRIAVVAGAECGRSADVAEAVVADAELAGADGADATAAPITTALIDARATESRDEDLIGRFLSRQALGVGRQVVNGALRASVPAAAAV
jgi:hypothetical protein